MKLTDPSAKLHPLKNTILIHLDTDSPTTLLRFWGLDRSAEPDYDIDRFYRQSLSRALECFDECKVPATFFCIGAEMDRSPSAKSLLIQAHTARHELANHTWTHPYDFAALPENTAREEIIRCSEWILRLIGKAPIGFRSPGYSVGPAVLDTLESLSYRYDSSMFDSWLNPLLGLYHRVLRTKTRQKSFENKRRMSPPRPYFPSRENIALPGPRRPLIEIPLLRSSLGLPFYCNFHLSTGAAYRSWDVRLLSNPSGPYLFHLAEFCDLNDGLPKRLKVHPNLAIPVEKKLRHIRETLRLFKKRFRILRTEDFVSELTTEFRR